MKRLIAVAGLACVCAGVHAQSGRLFVGEYGYDPDNMPYCYETNLDAGFPGSVTWNPTYQFLVQGAACTPGNLIYLVTGTFSTNLYVTIPGRAPTLVAPTSQTIFDMGYVGGKLYGWAEYASPTGIYEINPTTGACTLAVASSSELFFALDGNPADGMLYGYSEYGVTGLYRINPLTGEKHRIAPPPPNSIFPNAYGMSRGLAVGNNTVYLTNTWNGRALDDPDHTPADTYYAYDLAQGDNGSYVAFANPYANSTPVGGGAYWYDPNVIPDVPTPANDTCDHATPVGEGSFPFDTSWANNDGWSGCSGFNDVWFLYTPTQTRYIQFSTCGGAEFDTVLDIMEPGCTNTLFDCNDDNPSCAPQSTVGYHATAGSPVLVRVAGWGFTESDGARGTGTLTIGGCPGITVDRQPLDATINSCTAGASSSGADFFVRFTVFASGRNDISYQWMRNGVPLTDVGSGSVEEYGRIGSNSWSVILVRPTEADAGEYTCVMTSNECDEPLTVTTDAAVLTYCAADFNCDHVVDFFDYLDFVEGFASQSAGADFNHDGIIDFFDYLDFVDGFARGC